jgi:hypothetical protein
MSSDAHSIALAQWTLIAACLGGCTNGDTGSGPPSSMDASDVSQGTREASDVSPPTPDAADASSREATMEASGAVVDGGADVFDAGDADALGDALLDQCPPTIPDAGPCNAQPQLACDYGVDGRLLPNNPPCDYRGASCLAGQWEFAHNDPGSPQCGWWPYDSGASDECTPEGGVCIDPTIDNCPTGFVYAHVPCKPYPKNYCCAPLVLGDP